MVKFGQFYTVLYSLSFFFCKSQVRLKTSFTSFFMNMIRELGLLSWPSSGCSLVYPPYGLGPPTALGCPPPPGRLPSPRPALLQQLLNGNIIYRMDVYSPYSFQILSLWSVTSKASLRFKKSLISSHH